MMNRVDAQNIEEFLTNNTDYDNRLKALVKLFGFCTVVNNNIKAYRPQDVGLVPSIGKLKVVGVKQVRDTFYVTLQTEKDRILFDIFANTKIKKHLEENDNRLSALKFGLPSFFVPEDSTTPIHYVPVECF